MPAKKISAVGEVRPELVFDESSLRFFGETSTERPVVVGEEYFKQASPLGTDFFENFIKIISNKELLKEYVEKIYYNYDDIIKTGSASGVPLDVEAVMNLININPYNNFNLHITPHQTTQHAQPVFDYSQYIQQSPKNILDLI